MPLEPRLLADLVYYDPNWFTSLSDPLVHRASARTSLRLIATVSFFAFALSVSTVTYAQDTAEVSSGLSTAAPGAAPSLPSTAAPTENAGSLPGVIRMQLPMAGPGLVALSAQAGYGLYPRVGTATGASHQLEGQLALGINPLSFLSARVQFRGDLNLHPSGDSSAYGEPSFALRGFGKLGPHLRLGGEVEVRIIGASAPNVDFAATTPTFRGLAAYQLGGSTWLAAQLGYRLDNSAHAIENIDRLVDADRTMVSASSFDALEMGLGVSHRMHKTEILGEVTADALLGKGAPSFGQSPISIALGLRHELLYNLSLRAHAEVSPSARPEPYPTDVLIASRPRFDLGIGVTYRFGAEKPKSRAEETGPSQQVEEKPVEEPPAPAANTSTLRGSVVDEGGRPMTDVKVVMSRADGSTVEVFTDANGQFAFVDQPYGAVSVVTDTAGYDPAKREAEISADEAQPLEITIYESLPAGQVRGKVLDYSGKAVAATVVISPGNQSVTLDSDGGFSVDLKPGRYTVKFSHPDYRTQVRTVRVQDKGVVVLNIALEK